MLLHLLKRLATKLGLHLTVAHANHQLRGADSEADETFARKLAAEMGVNCCVERLAVREEMARTRESVEMVARRLRHRFLAQVAVDCGASHIALAHHAGDQAELFFLRLLRGAGGEGLGGMKWASPSPADPALTLIRPLLNISKADLLADAGARHLAFREDLSNLDRTVLRNRIRQELLPLLARDYAPAISRLVARTGELVAEETDFVRKAADRWLRSPRRTAFARLHVAVQRAVIREQLWQLGQAGDFELVERLRLQTGTVTSPNGAQIRRNEAGVIGPSAARAARGFSRASGLIEFAQHPGTLEFDGVRVTWKIEPHRRFPAARPGREHLDADKVGDRVTLRHWQPGDRFQPLGLSRPAKLQDLFVNRKVPAARRRQLVVAETAGGEICWVEGLPPGEACRLTAETRRRLRLGWKRRADG